MRRYLAVLPLILLACRIVSAGEDVPSTLGMPDSKTLPGLALMQFIDHTHFDLVNAISAALNLRETAYGGEGQRSRSADILCSSGVAFRTAFVWTAGHGDEFITKEDLARAFRDAGADCNLGPDWESPDMARETKAIWRRVMSSINIDSPVIAQGLVADEPWKWVIVGGYSTEGAQQMLVSRLDTDERAVERPLGQCRLVLFRPSKAQALEGRQYLTAVLERAVAEADNPPVLPKPVQVVGDAAWAQWSATLRDDQRFAGPGLAKEADCNDALLNLIADARAGAGEFLMKYCRYAPKTIYDIRVAAATYNQTAFALRKFAPRTREEGAKLLADPAWRAKLAEVIDASADRDREAMRLLRRVLGSLPKRQG
jgi:hypothetical protein